MSDLKISNVDKIHSDLLDGISDTYQKTQGFPTFDLLRAVALGLKKLWDKVFKIEWLQDVDNLTGDDLERFVKQRKGLTRNPAVKASGVIRIVSGSGTINVGDLFSTQSGIQYRAVESVDVALNSIVRIEAVEAGNAGNAVAEIINSMPVTLKGIAEIINDSPITGGYDAESDNALRVRYYEALRLPATCGNKYHYIKWAKEVAGVGGVKVIPVWNGKNTVKVVIIGNDGTPADSTLIEAVQNHIDPFVNGDGSGECPIGAVCTVVPANTFSINISADIRYLSNVNKESVNENIRKNIDTHIRELAFNSDYISYGKIGALILSTDGVLDYNNLSINGEKANIEIDNVSVAVLSEVSINEYI